MIRAVIAKTFGGEHIYRMLFIEWLAHRHIETLLHLLEGADYFNPQQYNSAFVAGLDELLGRIHDPAAREQIEALQKL